MRRAGRQGRHAQAPGQDSFLDIVANVVGILIILVMVIGARATDAMVEAAPQVDEPPAVDVDTPEAAAASLESDIHAIAEKIKREEFEIEYRSKERDKINVCVAALERELEQQRLKLNDSQKQQFDLQRDMADSRKQLEELERSRRVVENSTSTPDVIEHLPTPMARTVFGKQLHVRLLGGRLTYVPWDELVEMLKAEAPQKVWKLKDAPTITETIGPVLGFRLKYTLKRTERALRTEVGIAVKTGVELDRFILVPVADRLGEPLSEALRDGSEFRGRLRGLNPQHATVTAWVYPDSFDEFRTLKQALFERGFAAAARPLPEGFPIGGSPSGSRSAAQ
jgi:hypothetical protein